MKNYWNNLNDRERIILLSGAGFCALLLLYLLIFSPLLNAVQRRSQEFQEKSTDIVWMQSALKNQNQQRPSSTLNKAQLLAFVSKQLQSSDLQKYSPQLQQTADGDIQLSFEKVPFNLSLKWLWDLHQKTNFLIKQMNAERLETAGLVKLVFILSAV